MTWADLENKADKPEPHEDKLIPLRHAAQRAFAAKNQAPLREELERLVRRPSYAPGRTAEDVAYLEGCRRVAIDLLRMGGVYE